MMDGSKIKVGVNVGVKPVVGVGIVGGVVVGLGVGKIEGGNVGRRNIPSGNLGSGGSLKVQEKRFKKKDKEKMAGKKVKVFLLGAFNIIWAEMIF